ncbi:bcl-2-binding component 3, isoforms 3/4-like isoform X2 [Haemorhous mexicanus]|uniref:bcl-2-binding component 3, isoforms 3/4-like isoform X2 n=1 Tax=Haemorhous mexicanus TaxID=30427 RepID=UPI0028BD8542|nr:bcl-2-binding component 3, isoforms 3/4-like isoform X2 [Haemorhous mexicanus]
MPVSYYFREINKREGQTSRGSTGSSQDAALGYRSRRDPAAAGAVRALPERAVPLPARTRPRPEEEEDEEKGAPRGRAGTGRSRPLFARCQTRRARSAHLPGPSAPPAPLRPRPRSERHRSPLSLSLSWRRRGGPGCRPPSGKGRNCPLSCGRAGEEALRPGTGGTRGL